MEIRQLECFIAVAEELHFGRAAERLFISQPPLSVHIRTLETTLGFELFVRHPGAVALTAEGAQFLAEARRMLNAVSRTRRVISLMASGSLDWLSIGFVESSGGRILPEILQKFRRLHPGIELQLTEMTTAEQVSAISEGQLDIGISRDALPHPPLAAASFRRERIVAALPIAHELASREEISILELASEEFLFSRRDAAPRWNDRLLSILREADVTPRSSEPATQLTSILGLVSAGLGVTLVPESAARAWGGEASFLPLVEKTAYTEIVLLWNEQTVASGVKTFLDVVLDSAGQEAQE